MISALRVAVADDSVLLREGLVRVLGEAGCEVVGSYGNADELLRDLPRLVPELVVLDVRMPPTFRDEGVRAAIMARTMLPGVAIIEIKQRPFNRDSVAMSTLRAAHGRAEAMSKYCAAMALLLPDLRVNRLLPELRFLQRGVS